MRVIYRKLPSRRIDCVAAIGVFDGVHLGHQYVLEKLKAFAVSDKLASLVITFDLPPEFILHNRFHIHSKFYGYLTDYYDKQIIFKSLDIDFLWFLKSSKRLFNMSGQEFMDYIMKYFSIKKIIVGEDFHFGRNSKNSIACLKEFSNAHKIDVCVVKKIKKNKKIISSSAIRQYIKNANFTAAEKMLDRGYFVSGEVVQGCGVGKTLGFPTANINTGGHVIPCSGVYAGRVQLDGEMYLAAINIGCRPTVNFSMRHIFEAHILDFNKNILGKRIKVFFLKKLRDEKKFSSQVSLVKAIKKDVDFIRKKYTHVL